MGREGKNKAIPTVNRTVFNTDLVDEAVGDINVSAISRAGLPMVGCKKGELLHDRESLASFELNANKYSGV